MDADRYGNVDKVGSYVEAALTPAQWRYRLPFFASVHGPPDEPVIIHGNSSAVMEQELKYASDFGIDFWAFVAYPPPSKMFYAQELYLQITDRTQSTRVKFCVVMDGNQLSVLGRDTPRIISYFKRSSYQKVLGGRPLVFTFISAAWPASALANLTKATVEAGLPAPYVTRPMHGQSQLTIIL